MDRAGHQALQRDLAALVNFSAESRVSPYDQAAPEQRVLMIGSALSRAGMAWLRDHPRQAAWLDEVRVTPVECVERFRAWLGVQMADPGFRPARGA